MALIKCKECGKEFSETSNVCPNCGWTRKKQVGCLPIFFVGLGLYLFIGLLVHLGQNGGVSQIKSTTQKQQSNSILKELLGYQNIQFGMNKIQVKQLFEGKLVQSKEEYLEYIKDNAEITFWFFNDTLYEVQVKPNIKKKNMSSADDIADTINAMALKYGNYEKIPNMALSNDFFQQPVEYYKWTFKDNREISLAYLDLAKNNIPMALVWESVTITYKDLGLMQKKNLAEQQEQYKQLQDSAKRKQQELNGVI